jgi:molybdenum cofactor synthesis domain-containing protein
MPEPVIVELFIVGNELLTGDIQDANTHFFCNTVSGLGGRVARVTLLRDDLEVIALELRAAMDRGARVIFTSGGLGPTTDDLTLAAVARAAGVEVRAHDEARRMVKDRYDDLAARGILAVGGLTPAREKMACLPVGAVPLHNPIGTAPGVLLKAGGTFIVSLPGIPIELKGIFGSSLLPFLEETFGGGISVARTIELRHDESLIAPVLSRVVQRHPQVYVKSLVSTSARVGLKVTLTAMGRDQGGLETLVDAAMRDLQDGLASLG